MAGRLLFGLIGTLRTGMLRSQIFGPLNKDEDNWSISKVAEFDGNWSLKKITFQRLGRAVVVDCTAQLLNEINCTVNTAGVSSDVWQPTVTASHPNFNWKTLHSRLLLCNQTPGRTQSRLMYKLIWEVLFLFVLLLSAKAIARNPATTSELYANGKGRRMAGVKPDDSPCCGGYTPPPPCR
ncbi:hypothetical protein L6164_017591 [Bauhinia variegata]|uniref:Uncharacterized protein n=1 Tax=Bauhinia variegata TaxID=167791 RepID=A0ACB9NDC4_BAUVA|nr:hypothetical protein L6164_017591 [Bauhinia variegata]